jgi:ABC-type transport system involved in multi-copper enzyme maturation permease subunit
MKDRLTLREWLTHFTGGNPIFDKEMRLRWQRGKLWVVPALTVGGLVALLLLTAAFGLWEPDYWRKGYPTTACILSWVVGSAVGLLVTPALAASTIASERQQGTLELLIITRVTPWQIILGKVVPCLLPMLLAVVPCLGLSAFFAFVGSVLDPSGNMWGYWTRAYLECFTAPLSVVFAACVGMFFSAVCRNIPGATVWSYAVTLGTYFTARCGLRFLAALGIVGVNPSPGNVAEMVGREAIVWIVFAWLAAAGLYGAKWRLEREAELH